MVRGAIVERLAHAGRSIELLLKECWNRRRRT
jgi:hypothetical protein